MAWATFQISSDVACNSGTAQASIPDVLTASVTERLAGDSSLTLTLPADSPAISALSEELILRVTEPDGTVSEWRILSIEDGSGRDTRW